MKNYRYIGAYRSDEWEDDTEWKARRLQFIWDFSKLYTNLYLELKMNKEKSAFYRINDCEVARIASSLDSYSDGEFNRYQKMDDYKCAEKLVELERMKVENMSEFLKKCNSNLYFYLNENRYDDIRQILNEEYDLKSEYLYYTKS